MKKVDLTDGKVIAVISKLAIPIMGSSFLQFANNIIDMIWVGNLGSGAVASVGTASFFVSLGFSVNSLVLVGAGIKVSHSIGEENKNSIQEYINSGFIVNLFLAVVYSLLMILAGRQIIGFFNINDTEIAQNAYKFLAISGVGLFFTFFNSYYSRIQGSFGNNNTSLVINSIGMVVNIILDPIFIYAFKLGVSGAAIATLIATLLMFILYKVKSKGLIEYKLKVKVSFKKIKDIIKLGSATALQRVLFTSINIFVARIVSDFGADAIAAQKVGIQIESISFMVIGGLNGAVASFTGQNFGAKKYDRIKRGFKDSIIVGIVYSGTIALMFFLFPDFLTRIFVREDATVTIAIAYLQIIAISMMFSAVEMVANGLFTGIGKPNIPSVISIVFTTLRIPIAFFLSRIIGINGIWISTAVTSIIKGIISYLMYRHEIKYFSSV